VSGLFSHFPDQPIPIRRSTQPRRGFKPSKIREVQDDLHLLRRCFNSHPANLLRSPQEDFSVTVASTALGKLLAEFFSERSNFGVSMLAADSTISIAMPLIEAFLIRHFTLPG